MFGAFCHRRFVSCKAEMEEEEEEDLRLLILVFSLVKAKAGVREIVDVRVDK